MIDAMVTARMPVDKKEAGNRVLGLLGTNASQAVNRLYDYIIEEQALPFPTENPRKRYTVKDIEAAQAWASKLVKSPSDERFAAMSLKDAKTDRLTQRIRA